MSLTADPRTSPRQIRTKPPLIPPRDAGASAVITVLPLGACEL
jgi:hypothetical protein